jgi:hypothetical protein
MATIIFSNVSNDNSDAIYLPQSFAVRTVGFLNQEVFEVTYFFKYIMEIYIYSKPDIKERPGYYPNSASNIVSTLVTSFIHIFSRFLFFKEGKWIFERKRWSKHTHISPTSS